MFEQFVTTVGRPNVRFHARTRWSLDALLALYGELGAYGVVSRKKSSGPFRSP